MSITEWRSGGCSAQCVALFAAENGNCITHTAHLIYHFLTPTPRFGNRLRSSSPQDVTALKLALRALYILLDLLVADPLFHV
jgi:hypothetical protein